MVEVLPNQFPVVAMAGRAVTKVVRRCYDAKEDKNLDLSECQLIAFPDAIYHLMRNTVLLTCDLSSNVFRKIPPKFAVKFTYITELNLSNNRLSSLPDEVRDMKELQKLDISNNDFDTIPKVIFKIPHLAQLNARKNYIEDVDVTKFRNFASLRELNMEENPLTRTAHIQLKGLEPSGKIIVHLSPLTTDNNTMDVDLSDFGETPPNSSI